MEGCPAGDAGPVLNTGGGSDAQGFDYAILPPIYMSLVPMVERRIPNPLVGGSSPSGHATFTLIAQLVEHRLDKA